MEHYRAFTSIADSKALQKQLDKAFEEASGYLFIKYLNVLRKKSGLNYELHQEDTNDV